MSNQVYIGKKNLNFELNEDFGDGETIIKSRGVSSAPSQIRYNYSLIPLPLLLYEKPKKVYSAYPKLGPSRWHKWLRLMRAWTLGSPSCCSCHCITWHTRRVEVGPMMAAVEKSNYWSVMIRTKRVLKSPRASDTLSTGRRRVFDHCARSGVRRAVLFGFLSLRQQRFASSKQPPATRESFSYRSVRSPASTTEDLCVIDVDMTHVIINAQ